MQQTQPMPVFRRIVLLGFAVFFCVSSVALYAQGNGRTAADFKILPLTAQTAEPLRKKFEDWLDRTTHEKITTQTSTHPHVVMWRASIQQVNLGHDTLHGLERVNRITNKSVKYISDYAHHELSDYWETPIETIVEGGDCEDIALLKAVALHHLGWPRENMHLLLGYTRYRGKKVAHAVLLVDHGGGHYVLDNLVDTLVPFSKSIIQPMYMLNMDNTQMYYTTTPPAGPFESSGGR